MFFQVSNIKERESKEKENWERLQNSHKRKCINGCCFPPKSFHSFILKSAFSTHKKKESTFLNWPSPFQQWKGSRFQQGFLEEGEFGGPAESFYFLVLKVCARFHLHLMNGIDIGALEIHAIVIFSLEIQRRERKCWKVGENFGREVHNASMAVVVL